MSEKIQLNLIPFHQIIYSPTEGRIHLIESGQFSNLSPDDKVGVLSSVYELLNRKLTDAKAQLMIIKQAQEQAIKEEASHD